MKRNLVKEDIRTSKKSLRWLLVAPFVIVLALLATIRRQGEHPDMKADRQKTVSSSHSSSNTDDNSKSKFRNNIRAYVRAESNDYDYSKLGGIHNLKINVINTSDYHLDKVRVKIKYIKSNGAVWDTHYEDFYDVKSNATATHTIPDTKRGTRVEYEISAVKSKALGL